MVKRRRTPGSFGMAGGAIMREIRRYVIGIVDTLEIGLMATIAVCRRTLLTTRVATAAIEGSMRPA